MYVHEGTKDEKNRRSEGGWEGAKKVDECTMERGEFGLAREIYEERFSDSLNKLEDYFLLFLSAFIDKTSHRGAF